MINQMLAKSNTKIDVHASRIIKSLLGRTQCWSRNFLAIFQKNCRSRPFTFAMSRIQCKMKLKSNEIEIQGQSQFPSNQRCRIHLCHGQTFLSLHMSASSFDFRTELQKIHRRSLKLLDSSSAKRERVLSPPPPSLLKTIQLREKFTI